MAASTEVVTNSFNDTVGPVVFVGKELGFTARGIFVLVGGFQVALGVMGNILLLSVLLALGVQSFHLLFVANLALADLLTTGYWLPFFVLDLLLERHPVMNDVHCQINAFAAYTCGATSVLSLASISLNRYLHVCHSHLCARLFTRTRVIVWCLALWAIAALFSFPPLLGAGSFEYDPVSHTCSSVNKPENWYIYITVICFCTVPFVFIAYWNAAIFNYWQLVKLNLTAHGRSRNGRVSKDGRAEDRATGDQTELDEFSQQSSDNNPCGAMHQFGSRRRKETIKERAFTRSLSVVVLLMFICFLPFVIIEAIDSTFKQPPELVISGVLMLVLNCSVNWIVYGLMNPSIRRSFYSRVWNLGRACPCPR